MSKNNGPYKGSGFTQRFRPITSGNRLPVPGSYSAQNVQQDVSPFSPHRVGVFYHQDSEDFSDGQALQDRNTPSPFYPLPVNTFLPPETPPPTEEPVVVKPNMEPTGLPPIPETPREARDEQSGEDTVVVTPKRNTSISSLRSRGLSVTNPGPKNSENASPQSSLGTQGIYSPSPQRGGFLDTKAWSAPSARPSVRQPSKPRSVSLSAKLMKNPQPLLSEYDVPSRQSTNVPRESVGDPFYVGPQLPPIGTGRDTSGGVSLSATEDAPSATDHAADTSEDFTAQEEPMSSPGTGLYTGQNLSDISNVNTTNPAMQAPQIGYPTLASSSSSSAATPMQGPTAARTPLPSTQQAQMAGTGASNDRTRSQLDLSVKRYTTAEQIYADQSRKLPFGSAAYRARAKASADLIKSGVLKLTNEQPQQMFSSRGSNRNRRPTSSSVEPTASYQMPKFPVGTLARPPGPLNQPDPVMNWIRSKGGLNCLEAWDHKPFAELCSQIVPSVAGVIKISEIPYTTIKSEITAFLGSRALIEPYPKGSGTYGIHIIMDRATAKSLDCYVEFQTQQAAQQIVDNYNKSARRTPRIGDRPVKITMSSQEELMKELFPRAKGITWNGQIPYYHPPQPGLNGFNGFTNAEETFHMVKFAEYPSRSRFSTKHPQRPYESMISLLSKFPWWEVGSITMEERDRYFSATLAQMNVLGDMFRRGNATSTVTPHLLLELLHVALSVPAFSERQRAQFLDATAGLCNSPVYVTNLAPHWPFKVLRRDEGVHEGLVLYYAGLLKFASQTIPQFDGTQFPGEHHNRPQNPNGPFGTFAVSYPQNLESFSLQEVADLEWSVLLNIMNTVLPPGPTDNAGDPNAAS